MFCFLNKLGLCNLRQFQEYLAETAYYSPVRQTQEIFFSSVKFFYQRFSVLPFNANCISGIIAYQRKSRVGKISADYAADIRTSVQRKKLHIRKVIVRNEHTVSVFTYIRCHLREAVMLPQHSARKHFLYPVFLPVLKILAAECNNPYTVNRDKTAAQTQ